MTIEEICDRLAGEAGLKQVTMNVDGMTLAIHPFPPDSIDAAVRGIPEGIGYMLNRFVTGKHHATLFSYGETIGRFESDYHDQAAHAVYTAAAKARGWM